MRLGRQPLDVRFCRSADGCSTFPVFDLHDEFSDDVKVAADPRGVVLKTVSADNCGCHCFAPVGGACCCHVRTIHPVIGNRPEQWPCFVAFYGKYFRITSSSNSSVIRPVLSKLRFVAPVLRTEQLPPRVRLSRRSVSNRKYLLDQSSDSASQPTPSAYDPSLVSSHR
jgi:hypothetical protein